MRVSTFLFSCFKEKQFKSVSLFVLIAFVVVCVASVGTWRLSKANRGSITTAETETASPSTQTLGNPSTEQITMPNSFEPTVQSNSERLEVERVTLRPDGFEPSAITRPHGRFLFAVNDRSGTSGELLFRLYRESGEALREMRSSHRRREERKIFDIAPGRYVLRVVGHPDWVCQITITQN